MRLTHFAPLFLLTLASRLLADFTPGSINGQEGWSGGGGGNIDAGVAQSMAAGEGLSPNGAFLFSNSGPTNGGFAGWVFSPALGATAGQPASGATADSMSVQFWFKSISAVADGTNLEFDFATSGGSDRNNFFALTNDTDSDGGFKIRFTGSDINGFTPATLLATDMSRNTWNKVDIVFTGIDGNANDTLSILLNDIAIASSASTFEGYRNSIAAAYQTVNGILMRSGTRASGVDSSFNDSTSPQGILVDDLTMRIYSSAAPGVTLASYSTDFTVIPVPEPATWAALAGIGALGLAFWRRRRA